MDIEIDLSLPLAESDRQLAPECVAGLAERTNLCVTIGEKLVFQAGYEDWNGAIEAALMDFLRRTEALRAMVQKPGGSIRIGVFFSTAEAAAFSIELSSRAIEELSHIGVSLDVTAYPCA